MIPYRLPWNDYFMLMAVLTSYRSPDPNTKVGAVLVSLENIILGTGYNGIPRGIDPIGIPWDRENNNPELTKYPYICHAEENAIHNSNNSLKNAILFTTLYPCNECMKSIIQVGISKIYYLENKYKEEWFTKVATQLANKVGIFLIQHKWSPGTKECLSSLMNLPLL